MKKIFCIFLFCISFSIFAQSTDSIVLSYERNFVRASLLTKIELLQDSAKVKNVSMAPLYADALSFVINNYSILQNDSSLRELAILAINLSADSNSSQNLELIWKVFDVYPDLNVKRIVLSACSKLGKGNQTVIDAVNAFMTNQLANYEAGSVIDVGLFKDGIVSLGEMGSTSSFELLFRTLMSNIDDSTKELAFNALLKLDGDLKEKLTVLITQGTDEQKLYGFEMAMKYEGIDSVIRGELAESALSNALKANADGTESKAMFDLRYISVSIIKEVKWVKAVPLVIKHFYLAQNEFRSGFASIGQFTDAISALGAMGSSDCAQSLAIYLGLLNSEMEQTKNYNEQVMLAIIKSLGELGDKVSFDYLLYVSYLDYPETIQIASRDALERLKW